MYNTKNLENLVTCEFIIYNQYMNGMNSVTMGFFLDTETCVMCKQPFCESKNEMENSLFASVS